jgi:hypothetical protein
MAQAPKKAKKAKKAKKKAAGACTPSAAAIAAARPIVLQALGTTHVTDATKLADIGFDDFLSKGAIGQMLRKLGVKINNGPIQQCETVLDVIEAVACVQG